VAEELPGGDCAMGTRLFLLVDIANPGIARYV
jgi:hypothetical protein